MTSRGEMLCPVLPQAESTLDTLRKKCYWIKSISSQKQVYHGFKSICYRISNIFMGSCSKFLWINSINAFGKRCFWFNSIFFSVSHQTNYLYQCPNEKKIYPSFFCQIDWHYQFFEIAKFLSICLNNFA